MIPGSSRPARKLKLNEAVLTADSFPGTGSDRHRVFLRLRISGLLPVRHRWYPVIWCRPEMKWKIKNRR